MVAGWVQGGCAIVSLTRAASTWKRNVNVRPVIMTVA
jgi:hypothetical protein